jgi:hypothetical protein
VFRSGVGFDEHPLMGSCRISRDKDAVIGGFGEFVNQQGGRLASDLRAVLTSGRAKARADVVATKFIDSSVHPERRCSPCADGTSGCLMAR